MAERVLGELGFTNVQEHHPWNAMQFEKTIGFCTLKVWSHDSGELTVQVYEDDECMVELVNTESEATLRAVISRAEEFFGYLAGLSENLPEGEDA